MVNFTPWVCIIASAIIACTFATLPTAYSNEIVSPLTENQYQLQFIDFVKNHKKQYEVTEFFERFNIFKENLDWIREFNSNPDKTQTVGVNFFADLKPSEWNRFMGFKAPEDYKEPNYKAMEDLDLSDIPELKEVYSKYTTDDAPQTLDWVKEGDAMPIRNQGQCGSCFSFSSVATMESLYLINQNKTNDTSVSDDVLGHFSTQEPVDCAWGSPYYCQGCNGGFPASVMYFVRDNGICLDKDYPYEGVTGYCRMNDCKSVYKVDGAVDVSGYSELVMARAAAVNPLAIAITAQAREFMYYKSGIINYCSVYTTTQPDHAVAIYGYNLTHPVKYWTIRNSWGTNWGEDGYVRFRFGGNVCKIRYNVHYPIVKDAKTPVLDRELTLNTDNTPLPIENTPIV